MIASIFHFFIFNYVHGCIFMYRSVHMSASAQEGHKGVPDPMKLELNRQLWVA